MLKTPLIINNFKLGAKESPYIKGFNSFRGLDPHTKEGSVVLERKMTRLNALRVASQNFTAVAATNIISFTNALQEGCPVTVSNSGGALPAGLAASTIYFVISISGSTCKLSLTFGGTEVDITDAGTGTHSIVTVNMGTPIGTAGNIFVLDSNGRVWKVNATPVAQLMNKSDGTEGHTLGTSGLGIGYWKGYILVARATGGSNLDLAVDFMLESSGVWSASSFTFTGATPDLASTGGTPILSASDDQLYLGSGKKIYLISEVLTKTFDPTDNTTYTNNAGATVLTLPTGYVITCFAEIGDRLLSGTRYGGNVADIFPWSKTIGESYTLPIRIGDDGVNSIVNADNIVYISCGTSGRIYITNGVTAQLLDKLPFDTSSLGVAVRTDAMDYRNGELLIATSKSSASVYSYPLGLWGYKKGWRYYGLNSDGFDGTEAGSASRDCKTVYVSSPTIVYMGWAKPTDSGVDIYLYSASYIGSYGGYFESEYNILGTPNNENVVDSIGIILGKNLATGEGVRVSYRTLATGSYTVLETFSFATYGAKQSKFTPVTLNNLIGLQIKVELLGTAATTPELVAIVIR